MNQYFTTKCKAITEKNPACKLWGLACCPTQGEGELLSRGTGRAGHGGDTPAGPSLGSLSPRGAPEGPTGKEQELSKSPWGEQGAGSSAAAWNTPCQITFMSKRAFAPGQGRGRGGGRGEGGGGGRSAPGWGAQPGPGTPCRCELAGDGPSPAEPGRSAGLVLYFTFYLSPDPLPGRRARGAAGGFPSRLGCVVELPLRAPRQRIAGTAPLCAGRYGTARTEGPGLPGVAWSSAVAAPGRASASAATELSSSQLQFTNRRSFLAVGTLV